MFDRGVAAVTAQLGAGACDITVDDAGYFALFATARDARWLKGVACEVERSSLPDVRGAPRRLHVDPPSSP